MNRTFIVSLIVAAIVLAIGCSAAAAQPTANRVTPLREVKVSRLAPIDRSSVVGEGAIPVVFIAELGCDETAYADFAKRNASRFTTHTLVLPGSVKGSQAPPLERGQVRDPLWLANASDAVREYCREKGIEKPLVIGHGAGGMVAYVLSIREPDLARAYAVLNSLPAPSVGGLGRIPLPDQRAAEVDKLERRAILALDQRAWKERVAASAMRQTTDPKRAEALIEMQSSAPIPAVRRYALEPLYQDLREDLKGVSTPILVIAALPDWLAERDRALLRAAFQNAAFERPSIRLHFLDGTRTWAAVASAELFDPPLFELIGLDAGEKPASTPAAEEKK